MQPGAPEDGVSGVQPGAPEDGVSGGTARRAWQRSQRGSAGPCRSRVPLPHRGRQSGPSRHWIDVPAPAETLPASSRATCTGRGPWNRSINPQASLSYTKSSD